MMKHRLAAVGLLWVGSATGLGHVPFLSDGSAVDAESAIVLADVQVSRVFYHEVTAEAPQLWLAFAVAAPQSVATKLAVPKIDRLADFRPALALLGPGVGNDEVPFAVPAGLGARVIRTEEVRDPPVYDEVFTGTQAWELFDGSLELPAAGQYYVVAYAPGEATGKLWVALGLKEVFTPEDIATLREDVAAVREFHEVGPDAMPPCFLFALVAGLVGLRLVRVCRGV
jgi:hypothetical protein